MAARAVLVVREAPCAPPDAAHCAAVGPPKQRFLAERSDGRTGRAAAAVGDAPASFGTVVLTEVQALGRPLAVSNVLLGQAATSTSLCHERPTYVPLGRHGTQFPSMAGSTIFDTEGEHACLEACQADAGCLAVSYLTTAAHTKCVLSPSPLLGDGVVWKNLAELGGGSANTTSSLDGAEHFTKTVPLRRIEPMTDHVHDGAMLDQFCVEDISVSPPFRFDSAVPGSLARARSLSQLHWCSLSRLLSCSAALVLSLSLSLSGALALAHSLGNALHICTHGRSVTRSLVLSLCRSIDLFI
jgi:hypothetical protein